MNKYLFIILLNISFNYFGLSQNFFVPNRNFSTINGLPSNEIYDIIQDRHGNMWFATDNGLCKYDGLTFKTYDIQDGLTDRVVFDLQELKDGRIFMSTINKKIFFLDSLHKTCTEIPIVFKTFKQINSSRKLEFYFDSSKQELHVGISNENKYFIVMNEFTKIREVKNPENILYKLGNKLLVSYNFSYDPKNVNNILANNLKFINYSTYHLTTFGNYINYWAGDYSLTFNAKKAYHQKSKSITTGFFMQNKYLLGIFGKEGLVSCNSIKEFQENKYDILIPNIVVSKIIKDSYNNIWISTLNKGVYILSNTLDKIIPRPKFFDDGLNILSKINEIEIFDISTNGMVHNFNLKNNTFNKVNFKYPVKNLTYKLNKLYGTMMDKKLFIGFDQMLLRNKYCTSNYFEIDTDSSNIIYNITGNSIQKIYVNEKGISSKLDARPNSFLVFNKDSLLIVTNNGLFSLNIPKISTLQHIHPFFNHRLDFIKKLNNQTIIVGSKTNGIALCQKNNYIFFDSKNGFDETALRDIEIVNDSTFWTAGKTGCYIVSLNNKSQLHYRKFDLNHGLPSNNIIDLLYLKKINKMVIGLDDYIYIKNISSYDSIGKTKIKNKPKIIKILVNNKILTQEKLSSLSFKQNNIKIYFHTINYNMKSQSPHQFRINNGPWNNMNSDNTIELYSLTPRSYEFQVRSQNQDNEWSDPTAFHFNIQKPWWQTLYFYFSLILATGLISYFLYRRRVYRIQNQNEMKSEMVKLERAALQAQMNPHFIFNSLNSIQNFILNQDKIDASEYLSKFAHLIRMNLDYSNKTKITIEKELHMLSIYLDLEKLRFKDKFEFEFVLINISEEDTLNIAIPPMLIQPIIENAIKHGVAKIESQGKIIIELKNEDRYLIVTITDNGVGLSHVKDELQHISMGTSITSKRLNNLIQNKDGNNFSLENLFDDKGNILGAQAVMKISIN